MADLEAYKDKFSESGQRVFQNALNESRRRDQNYISVEHIVSALSKEEPDLFNCALERARSRGRKTIEATDIFDVLSKYDSLFVDVLRSLGANPEAVVEHVRTNVDEREQKDEQYRKK